MPETADARQTQGVQSDSERAEPEDEALQARAEREGEDGVHRLQSRDATGSPGSWDNLQRMLDVPLSLTVELGSTEMPLSEVLKLDSGSVVTIDRLPGEPIDLLINGRLFARGEVVVVNDTFGYRITELIDDGDETLGTAGPERDRSMEGETP